VKGAFSTKVAYVSVAQEGSRQNFRLIKADADGERAQMILESPEPILSPCLVAGRHAARLRLVRGSPPGHLSPGDRDR
jgi:Tol biopolymer transport system component